MNNLENSWHLEVANFEDSSMIQDYYFCSCGNRHIISRHMNDFPFCICPECANTYYMYTSNFNESCAFKWRNFKFDFHLYEDTTGWYIEYFYFMPHFDEAPNKFIFTREVISRSVLNKFGKLEHCNYNMLFFKNQIFDENDNDIGEYIEDNYAKQLLKLVYTSFPSSLLWLNRNKLDSYSEKETLEIMSFFLQNPHMKDENLSHWDFFNCKTLIKETSTVYDGLISILGVHKKRTVLRALYKSYSYSMQENYYDPTFDYVACRVFSDENFLSLLLSLTHKEKNELFENFEAESLVKVFEFLKIHYTEKELHKIILQAIESQNDYNKLSKISCLFSSKETYRDNLDFMVDVLEDEYDSRPGELLDVFHDIINMIHEEDTFHLFVNYFTRVKSNLIAIHDEIAKIDRLYVRPYLRDRKLKHFKRPFIYSNDAEKLQ